MSFNAAMFHVINIGDKIIIYHLPLPHQRSPYRLMVNDKHVFLICLSIFPTDAADRATLPTFISRLSDVTEKAVVAMELLVKLLVTSLGAI